VRIKRPIGTVLVGSHTAPYPTVTVAFRSGENTSSRKLAIVDSGAAATLLPWSLAEELGIDGAAKVAPRAKFSGLGGSDFGREMTIDLVFSSKEVLPNVKVYFIEGTRHIVSRDGLLGQLGFFDRMKLVQCSGGETPFFVLDGE